MSLQLYLEEVLDALWVIAVALSADPLHLFDLARLAGSLDVFEVNLGVLTEVHDRAQEVEQTWETQSLMISFKRHACLQLLPSNYNIIDPVIHPEKILLM